ncbi:hypothetical protein [Methanogenium sp. MK-MG]|uniref:hypothetical protein n=1 Tax=Methanogenium sp. MK-MG TaxID=2599926 RepID=UPI0013EBE224|nr:hypothetical protein [Methanogenium sp. MK-MG]KAF1078078.1 hypothetical protein MKMG_00998 [Methanogenium sp. MK-MG]
MGLFSFRSYRQYVWCLPALVSVLVLVAILCTGAVSAEPIAPGLSGTPAHYTAGEEITLGGVTNLAPGTVFLISVEAVAFLPTEKGEGGAFSGTSGTVVVQEGPPAFWSFSFSTGGWTPGEYLVSVEAPKTGTVESGTFTLLPAEETAEVPALSSPSPTSPDMPESSPLPPTASPAAVPLSPAAGVAGFVVVYLFRAYVR